MPKAKLSQIFCKTVGPSDRLVEYADDNPAYRGLRLVVTKSGDKAFAFRSNPYYQTIGSYPAISLAKAREQTAKWKLAINAGESPFKAIKERKKEARHPPTSNVPTIGELWDEYDREYLVATSKKHRTNANRSMRKHFLPVFGTMPINHVPGQTLHSFRIKHSAERLREMEMMKTYLSAMINWAREHEIHQSGYYLSTPPQFGRIDRKRSKQNRIRTRKLTRTDDIRAYWQALHNTHGPRATMLALQFLFLTCKRGIEVQRLTLDQIDFEHGAWIIPAEISKSKREVSQPLTLAMSRIITEAAGNRTNGYVFSNTSGEKQVMLANAKLHRRICDEAGTSYISTHDYRRTISTRLEEMGTPARVLSLIKGHYDFGIAVHYDQAEKRPRDEQLEAYKRWQDFLGVVQ